MQLIQRGYDNFVTAKLAAHYENHRTSDEWREILVRDYPLILIQVRRLDAVVSRFFGPEAHVALTVAADNGFAPFASVEISTSAGDVLTFKLSDAGLSDGGKQFDTNPDQFVESIEFRVIQSFTRNAKFKPLEA